ncbi:MAG TPA: hypothetical protein VGD14_14815 [bacterium]
MTKTYKEQLPCAGTGEEAEHHGDFLRGIIWRVQNSSPTPFAPFLIVKELLITRCSKKNGAASMLLKNGAFSICEAKFF